MSAVADRTDLQERVADFLERCAHTLDEGRFEDWSALFTDDALYQITTRENLDAGMPIGIVRCEGRGMIDDRIKALRIANIYESHAHRHLLGRPVLSQEDDGAVTVRSSFVIYRVMYTGQTEVFATGRYDDTLVERDERWRFASRRVVLDSRLLDTLLVYPI